MTIKIYFYLMPLYLTISHSLKTFVKSPLWEEELIRLKPYYSELFKSNLSLKQLIDLVFMSFGVWKLSLSTPKKTCDYNLKKNVLIKKSFD